MVYLKISKDNETIEEVFIQELHEPDKDVNIYETASRHDDAVSERFLLKLPKKPVCFSIKAKG